MQDMFLRRVEELTPNIKTFWFEPSQPSRYLPGQFVDIHLPHANPDNRGETRQMTLSSSPIEDLFGITVRFTPEHGSSFKEALQALPIGGKLRMSEPIGDFVLPKDTSVPLVFVSAGVGVTPVRSIVTWLLAHNEERNLQLVHTVRSEHDFIFHDTFARYPMRLQQIVSRPSVNWGGLAGRLNATQLLSLVDYDASAWFYVAGPALFADTMKKDLQVLGIPPLQIISDSYPGYTD